jgi:hypothetical protein
MSEYKKGLKMFVRKLIKSSNIHHRYPEHIEGTGRKYECMSLGGMQGSCEKNHHE